jgi:ankyrin repeat protein
MEATTLHMAAAGGHAKIVKILLENGANPEDENAVSRNTENGVVSFSKLID